MTEPSAKDSFLAVYNKCADDIFAYCYGRVAHRDIAKYLTRNIFMKAWDQVASAGASPREIERSLKRIARDHISGFVLNTRQWASYTDNLWNLTLSQ